MTLGFVRSTVELFTCGRGITPVRGLHQLTCPLLYRLALMLVFGLCVWKWTSSVTTLDPNQNCSIGFDGSASGIAHSLACTRKLGKCRSSEGLRSFNPSKGTNLLILIILAGDIEMNPGPRSQCRLCKKYCKASEKSVKCDECEKRFHISCINLEEKELLELESGNGSWYCTNCKADCGLCSGAVLYGHKAVQCDKCEMWIHNECSLITESEFDSVENTNCTWICPNCDFFNFSDSFFAEHLTLENQNRFDPLANDSGAKAPQTGSDKNKFISGLKFVSININSIRGKKLELLAFLDFHQPQIVAIQETKIDSSISTSELFPESCTYNVYRKDGTLDGGGVMLLIHKDIPHMPITELENDSESVWVKVFANKTSQFVASWYRPPGGDLDKLQLQLTWFKSKLEKIKDIHKGNKLPSVHILGGDFNFCDIVWPDRLSKSGSPLSLSEGEKFIEILNDHHLEQLVHFPTREKNTLDLIITSLPQSVS